jgi:hypothetical protein
VSAANVQEPVHQLRASQFRCFDDRHCPLLGCGFAPADVLKELNKGKDCSVLQVRIFAPKLGVFKGLLCVKNGIDKIELPYSMRKVRRSVVCSDDWASVIVKSSFPTKKNIQLGKLLKKERITNQSDAKKSSRAGKMIERLWKCLGVPEAVYRKYDRQVRAVHNIQHTYLVGVPDMTGTLPKSHVFIAGFGKEMGMHKKVFVTRSPAVEPSDGHLLPVVNRKPAKMSNADWNLLESLPFGVLVFGNPRGDETPLPERIAGGDLDGDLYLVCWNEEIVSHIRPVEKVEFPDDCEHVGKIVDEDEITNSKNWLAEAQDFMLDADRYRQINILTGKLYSASGKVADESEDFMHDKLAIQLARAYKLSLDLQKHGGRLRVPASVRDCIDKSLKGLLVDDESTIARTGVSKSNRGGSTGPPKSHSMVKEELEEDEENNLYVVEQLLDFRPKKRSKSYEFLVRWEGFSPRYDEWLAGSDLNDLLREDAKAMLASKGLEDSTLP